MQSRRTIFLELLALLFLILSIISCTTQPPEQPSSPAKPEEPYIQPIQNEEEPAPFIQSPSQPQENHEQQQGAVKSGFSPLFTPLQGCEDKSSVAFAHLPLDTDKITVIEPQGELTGFVSGHITPGDHVGYQYDPNAAAISVYAMADGYLVHVERNPGYFGIGVKNYHLYMEYSCSMFGSYVHITEIAPELLNANVKLKELDSYDDAHIPSDKRNLYARIPFKAGQVIGKAEKWGLLGMLTVDTAKTLTGFITPDIYAGEPWKVHAVPVFDYFSESLKAQLMQKNPRISEPRGGKIDFDVPGKLAGNWFKEATDYAGDKSQPFCGDYLCPYWEGHLAFVPDFVDPEKIRVSIGYDAGLGDQGPYGVEGNSPDPKSTGVGESVKYGLVKLRDVTKERGFASNSKALVTENSNEVLGTMLVQLTGAQKLKMEVFPGKKASEVSGFSGKERKYYR